MNTNPEAEVLELLTTYGLECDAKVERLKEEVERLSTHIASLPPVATLEKECSRLRNMRDELATEVDRLRAEKDYQNVRVYGRDAKPHGYDVVDEEDCYEAIMTIIRRCGMTGNRFED